MEENYTEIQIKIMEATRRIIGKKGIKAATIREIATEAGANMAMINYYFRSKDKLIEAVYQEGFNMFFEKTFELLDSDLPFFEIVRKWVHVFYDIHLGYPYFYFLMHTEFNLNPQKIVAKYKDRGTSHILKKLSKLIKEEEIKGTIHPISALGFMLSFLSLVEFPFLSRPSTMQFLNLSEEEYTKLCNTQKEHVADFIIRAIKK